MEIKNENIIDFICTGILDRAKLQETKSIIFKEYGEPDYIEKYKNGNYYHFKDMRLFFSDDKLQEIAVLFSENEFAYSIREYADIIDKEFIDCNFSLHSMICLLNYLKTDWKFSHNQPYDYTEITVNKKTSIYYYLYTGRLEKISVWQR